ncbi:hypothetical protein ACGFSI_40525 [Streptomyces virginiae]|uniref:hypothetical protein n=1 Tax=Streptomyces virginiae TaxID=1961 RepID=UPI0037244E01
MADAQADRVSAAMARVVPRDGFGLAAAPPDPVNLASREGVPAGLEVRTWVDPILRTGATIMNRPFRTRVSPLFAFGAVLAAAGVVIYATPVPGVPVLAAGAFVLATAAALWVAANQR